jgi:hypothetical protein
MKHTPALLHVDLLSSSLSRCAKFKASGKATTSDKVATRKSSSGSIVPDWSRLHGIERPAVTVGDFQAQKEAVSGGTVTTSVTSADQTWDPQTDPHPRRGRWNDARS